VLVVADAGAGLVALLDATTLARVLVVRDLAEPSGVAVAGGRLLVAERGRNRVAVFNPFPAGDGARPALAIGQPDLAGALPNAGGISPASLFLGEGPVPGRAASGVAAVVTPAGVRLLVADPGNARVLRYTLAP
jgi:DNA-binding beta-propeller fold protein YncE